MSRFAWLTVVALASAYWSVDKSASQIIMYELPLPVTSDEVMRFATIAHMDSIQAGGIHAIQSAYWEKWQVMFGQSGPALRRLRVRLNNYNIDADQPDDRSAVDLLEQFDRESAQIVPVMRSMNDSLWADLRAALPPEQHDSLHRTISAHARREQERPGIAFRERSMDLSYLLEPLLHSSRAMNERSAPATATSARDTELRFNEAELDIIDRVLVDYEGDRARRLEALVSGGRRAAKPLAEAADLNKAVRVDRRRDVRILTREQATAMSERADAFQAFAMPHLVEPSRRLVDLNRATLRRLQDALPESVFNGIKQLYDSTAYPEVYPDSVDANRLYEAAFALDNLDDNQHAVLTALRQSFQIEHDRHSRRMMECIYRRGEVTFGRQMDYAEQAVALWNQLADLGRTRESLNLGQLTKIRSVLSSEQAARLPEWDFKKHPPKRPWMRGGK